MFNGIYFEYPIFGIILLLFIICAIFCKMRLSSFYFPHTSQFSKYISKKSKTLIILKWLSIIMLILAFMSPVKNKPFIIQPRKGIDIALILDASGSMNNIGFDRYNLNATKFDVVKAIVNRFISKRGHDNIGIVVFGTYSFIASPLTYDKNMLYQIVSKMHVAIAGIHTALYDSLAQSIKLLKNSHAKTKIAILMTDGYNTPQATKIPLHVALKMLNQYHIKVYTIGIGNSFDRVLLQHIATYTHAKMFSAKNALQLQHIYNQINKLEKSNIRSQNFTIKQYYFFYPLFIGLLALVLYVLVMNKRENV